MKSGARTQIEIGLTVLVQNFEFCYLHCGMGSSITYGFGVDIGGLL
jgi:hypothetical protein